MTHYDTLGIAQDAGKDELKKALRKLAMKYHPDNAATGDEEKMIKVNEAYEILSNPQERAAYDAELLQGNSADKPQFRPQESTDIFSNIFKTGHQKNSPKRGQDRKTNLTITLEESITGIHKDITIRISEPCEVCKGSGKKALDIEPCKTCKGTKKIITKTVNPFGHEAKTSRICQDCKDDVHEEELCNNCNGVKTKRVPLVVPVNIPAGIENNTKLLIKGCGEKGSDGGVPGDLLVTVIVENNSEFTRVGNNLHLHRKVTYSQLVLGAELDIETLEGTVKLNIPRGTKPGVDFQIKGGGVTRMENNRKGDLFVSLELVIPTDITEEQEKLLVALDL